MRLAFIEIFKNGKLMLAQGVRFMQCHLKACKLIWRDISLCDQQYKGIMVFVLLFVSFKQEFCIHSLECFEDLSQMETLPVRHFCFSSLPSCVLGPLPDLFLISISSSYRYLLHLSKLSFTLLFPLISNFTCLAYIYIMVFYSDFIVLYIV